MRKRILSLEEIRTAFLRRKYRLSAVGDEIGLTYAQMHYVMRGPNPPYHNVEKISLWLEGDNGNIRA